MSPGPRPVTAALAREATGRPRAGLVSRAVWAILSVVPLSVLVLAANLTPNPVGHGTHTQLGLPPCGFYVFTGYPCAGCGMTTAFAHMMRLELPQAAAANPFGIMLFLVTVTMVPLAALGSIRGWPVMATLDRLHAEKWAILLAVTSLLTWGIRVLAIAV